MKLEERLEGLYINLKQEFEFGYQEMPETQEEFVALVKGCYGFKGSYKTSEGDVYGDCLHVTCNERLQEVYCCSRSITADMRMFLNKHGIIC